MSFRRKIISWDKLPEQCAALRAIGKRLVVTNGCFDLLHLGHVTCLEKLNPDECCAVKQAGGKIVIIPIVPGKSTTDLMKCISRRRLAGAGV